MIKTVPIPIFELRSRRNNYTT